MDEFYELESYVYQAGEIVYVKTSWTGMFIYI